MILTNEIGNKKVFFGNGTLRIHCVRAVVPDVFIGHSLLIFGNLPFVEPGTKTNDELSPNNAEVTLFFENKEDLKVLKLAINHIEKQFDDD